MPSYIHLLYVPTMACNMQCRYCYLEDNTVDAGGGPAPLDTLRYAVDKMRGEGIIPFNISLHGGEVTTLDRETFRGLIDYISNYYSQNRDLLTGAGFTVGFPHIKTNLLALDRHIDTIRDYQVSVSGSLDLPFSLHDAYRVTKGGGKTLQKILDNIELLRTLPGRKKVSATIFREHAERARRSSCSFTIRSATHFWKPIWKKGFAARGSANSGRITARTATIAERSFSFWSGTETFTPACAGRRILTFITATFMSSP